MVNGLGKKVFAVDIPSGVFGKTGQYSNAVRAYKTITFQYRKPAHILYPGAEMCGEVVVCPIGLDGDQEADMYYVDTLVMPKRKRNTHKGSYGSLALVVGSKGMAGAIAKADELEKELENALVLGQFKNPANPEAHLLTTGPEIWDDTEGQVDIFVAGVGTGGTITGTGKYLKSKKPSVKAVAVEPKTSAVLSGEKAGAHGLQGIGAGFIPEILDTEVIDEIIKVENEEAYSASNLLAVKEGILTGITSGAALHAALKLADREENYGKTIVVLLPDTGERYLSTPLFK